MAAGPWSRETSAFFAPVCRTPDSLGRGPRRNPGKPGSEARRYRFPRRTWDNGPKGGARSLACRVPVRGDGRGRWEGPGGACARPTSVPVWFMNSPNARRHGTLLCEQRRRGGRRGGCRRRTLFAARSGRRLSDQTRFGRGRPGRQDRYARRLGHRRKPTGSKDPRASPRGPGRCSADYGKRFARSIVQGLFRRLREDRGFVRQGRHRRARRDVVPSILSFSPTA